MDKDENIYKRGDKYWLRITIGGREFRESLHTTSRKAAKKRRNDRIRELQGELAGGGLIKPFVEALVEFCDRLEERTHFTWAAETQKRYLCSMRAIARAFAVIAEDNDFDLYTFDIHALDLPNVADFVERRKQEVAIPTVNRDLTAFGAFMVYCKNKGWVCTNPVQLYEKQGMTEELPPIVLPNEDAIGRILSRGSLTFACLIRFIRAEGTRATESARIEWPDITFNPDDPTRATCLLRHTKGGEPRVIDLELTTVAMLHEMPRSNRWPYVFFNDGDEGWFRDLSTRFWQYGQDVEFGARLHDLRHEFAIRKLREGWSVYRVSRHLGHKSILTTERYYFRYLTDKEKTRARNSGNNGFS